MILLVYSSLDVAGETIAKIMRQNYPFTQTPQTYQQTPIAAAAINGKQAILLTLKEESIQAQHLQDDFPDAELVIFLSRHSSQSGKPTLSVHVPGNFGDAELGGLPRKVSVAPAVAMQTALKTLLQCKEQLRLAYEVSYECTHHGPSLPLPTMFVELGSSEMQWRDEAAAQAVAHAAMAAAAGFSLYGGSAVLGIGGTHYNQKFTLMALMGQAMFGHMIPKHAVFLVDSAMIRQCCERTLESVPLALLDWKGIRSEDKPGLLAALEAAELPYRRV